MDNGYGWMKRKHDLYVCMLENCLAMYNIIHILTGVIGIQ